MIYYTSDNHFFHKRICELSHRPFSSVEEMNDKITEKWNRRVSNNDDIYVLGDFHLGENFKENLPKTTFRLNGRKHLVLGNHDRAKNNGQIYLDAGFTSVQSRLEILVPVPYPAPCRGMWMAKVLMQHKPLNYKEMCDYHYVLHGHMHGVYKNRGIQIDVGVDIRDYEPKTFLELIEGVEPGDPIDVNPCLQCGIETHNTLQICSEICGYKQFEEPHEHRGR